MGGNNGVGKAIRYCRLKRELHLYNWIPHSIKLLWSGNLDILKRGPSTLPYQVWQFYARLNEVTAVLTCGRLTMWQTAPESPPIGNLLNFQSKADFSKSTDIPALVQSRCTKWGVFTFASTVVTIQLSPYLSRFLSHMSWPGTWRPPTTYMFQA